MAKLRNESHRGFTLSHALITAVFLVGVTGLVVAFYVPSPYAKAYPPLVIGAGILSTVVYRQRRRRGTTLPPLLSSSVRRRNVLALAYVLLVGATAALFAMAQSYPRALPVHLALLALQLVTVALVFSLESSRLALAAVVATGLVQRASVYYASAIQIGRDTLFHNNVAADIAATGSLDPLAFSKYWYAPVYHFLTGSATAILDVPVRHAAFLATTVPVTVIAAVAIYVLVGRFWNGRTAALGAFLYLAADHVIADAVLPGPTSLGLVLFLVMLAGIAPYLQGEHRYPWLFGVGLLVLFFTHQLSLFIATVGVGAYVVGQAVWYRETDPRDGVVLGLLSGSFLLQAIVTKYSGPAGEAGSFLDVVVTTLLRTIQSAGTRTSASLPESLDVAVSGADASSFLQVLGGGILFALGIVGTIYWVSEKRGAVRKAGIGYAATVVVMSFFVFVPPLVGVSFFIPGRWFAFLYAPLVVLAAPGLIATVSALSTYGRSLGGTDATRILLVVLVVTAPYVALMTWNGTGALDGPVLDDAPSADRLATTAAEQNTYEFVDRRAGATPVVADFQGWQIVDRHYRQPAVIYRTRYGESGPVYADERLYVYRSYADTQHVSYELRYRDSVTRVYGPLPGPEPRQSIVYTNGDEIVVYG